MHDDGRKVWGNRYGYPIHVSKPLLSRRKQDDNDDVVGPCEAKCSLAPDSPTADRFVERGMVRDIGRVSNKEWAVVGQV